MDIVYIGRYSRSAVKTGPEKVANRIFEKVSQKRKAVFVEYFFDGRKYGIIKKLFGKENIDNINECDITGLGVFPLISFLFKTRPKTIHIITFERIALAIFLYKLFFPVRIIYNVHGINVYENQFSGKQNWFCNIKDKIAESVFVKYSDLILLLSENSKNILLKYYKLSENRIRYIRNGVDSIFHTSGVGKISDGNNTLKVVFIGSPNRKEKGFSFLKESLELVKSKIELYIIDKKENNITLANNFIEVFCLDVMSPDELAEFLMDKDVFVSASSYDTFGLTSVESMSAGLVPVLTKETGASELIENGLNGFILDYGDTKKLAEVINTLASDRSLTERISLEAKKIYDKLSWDNIANEYLKLYKTDK